MTTFQIELRHHLRHLPAQHRIATAYGLFMQTGDQSHLREAHRLALDAMASRPHHGWCAAALLGNLRAEIGDAEDL